MNESSKITPLKIAILLNGYNSTYRPLTLASFQSAISAASNPSQVPEITFYDPIVAQIYPDPLQYDLIVLSGGTADPMGQDPWVLKLQDFLRRTVAEHPKQKIVGVCWGHQIISVTFGGVVGEMDGPELGVNEFDLTEKGRSLFPLAQHGRMKIHEFHRRHIKTPAEGFVPLLECNQAFVNQENTILTFQGHPELNPEVAKAMLDAAPVYMGIGEAKKSELYGGTGEGHDGVEIWKRILAWVHE